MKFVNQVTVGVADLVYVNLNCVVNGDKLSSDSICMTIEHFKQMTAIFSHTVEQIDAAIANKAKAN